MKSRCNFKSQILIIIVVLFVIVIGLIVLLMPLRILSINFPWKNRESKEKIIIYQSEIEKEILSGNVDITPSGASDSAVLAEKAKRNIILKKILETELISRGISVDGKEEVEITSDLRYVIEPYPAVETMVLLAIKEASRERLDMVCKDVYEKLATNFFDKTDAVRDYINSNYPDINFISSKTPVEKHLDKNDYFYNVAQEANQNKIYVVNINPESVCTLSRYLPLPGSVNLESFEDWLSKRIQNMEIVIKN